MNWLDVALAGLAVAGFIKGFSDGFVRQGVGLVALIAAIFLFSEVAVSLREYVLHTGWFPEYSVTAISYVLAFMLIAGLIVWIGEVVHRMVEVTPLSLLNHLVGGVFGLAVTVIFLSLTLNVLDGLDRHSDLLSQETKVESRFYVHVKAIVPIICPVELFVWKK
jgi:membrane protein required for colicin V production